MSEADLDDLRAGRGWGLALAAELNGVPGPAHLLELKEQIGLTPAQVTTLEALFGRMKAEAQEAGRRFIAAEAAIEDAFRRRSLTSDQLRHLIGDAAEARAQLHCVYLTRHLDTLPVLAPEQVARYNVVRGCRAGDPCLNVPVGHDAAMWRRHNNCR